MKKQFKVTLIFLLLSIICIQNIIAIPFSIEPNDDYIMVDGVRSYATIDSSANIVLLICAVLCLIFCMIDKKRKLKKLTFNAIFIMIWCIEILFISTKTDISIYTIPYYTIFLFLLSIVAGFIIFIRVIALLVNIYRDKRGKEVEIEKYKEKARKTFLIFSVPIVQRLGFNFGITRWGGAYKMGERIVGSEYNPMIDITLIIATLVSLTCVIICKWVFNFFQRKNNIDMMQ